MGIHTPTEYVLNIKCLLNEITLSRTSMLDVYTDSDYKYRRALRYTRSLVVSVVRLMLDLQS